jgi:outer membrane protein, multidrug efflux system
MHFALLVLVLVAGLCGCALKEPPTKADVLKQALGENATIPAAWKAGPQTGTAETDDWLAFLHDSVLEEIVAEALAYNLDLRQATERVSIAQQNLVRVGAQLEPQVNLFAGRKVFKERGEPRYNSTLAYASLGWEIDVWGRLRSERAAAAALYEATALDFAYARQSIAALAIKSWYLTVETRQLVKLSEESVAVFEELLRLVSFRFKSGKDSNLNVVDVRADLATARSALESSKQAYGEARRALEVLLGRYPAAEIEVAESYPDLPPLGAAGVPAALLGRRPDLIAAERQVLAAFRQAEAARLSLLPDFSISLAAGRLSDNLLSTLNLNPWIAMAGVDAAIPIYQGGSLRAVVKIANAQQAEAVASYGASALNAFREVENLLANDQLLSRRLPYEESAMEDRVAAVKIATLQYRTGKRDLLWVAQLTSDQFAAQASVIKLRSLLAANRIQLYLALGGNFDDKVSNKTGAGTNQNHQPLNSIAQ